MLVLSRKVGEELVIGDNIRVVISRVAGNRVAVGIEAPDDVHIVRGELKAIRDGFAEKRPPVDVSKRDVSKREVSKRGVSKRVDPSAQVEPNPSVAGAP